MTADWRATLEQIKAEGAMNKLIRFADDHGLTVATYRFPGGSHCVALTDPRGATVRLANRRRSWARMQAGTRGLSARLLLARIRREGIDDAF